MRFTLEQVTWECPYWDLLPALSQEAFDELRADILARGQQYPVLYTQTPEGTRRVIDGYHRLTAILQLLREGHEVKLLSRMMQPLEPALEREMALSLNLKRRHMTSEERAEWAVKLRAQGKSLRVIAEALGTSKDSVARDLREAGVASETPVTGKDGKTYATQRPQPSPATRLSILTPVERHDAAQSMYDQAEARAAQRKEEARSGVGTFLAAPARDTPQRAENAPLADAQPEDEAQTQEATSVADSVESCFAKVGPLEPSTLRPSVASSTRPNGERPSASTGAPAIMASGFDGWNTPPELLAVIERFAGRRGIALDPCSNAHSEVPAAIKLTRYDCGLQADWYEVICEGGQFRGREDTGIVYVNPPYDQAMLAHVNGHAREQASKGLSVVTLVPAKVDQQWYQDAVAKDASAICFVRGRVGFWREGQPAQGSAFACLLLHYGTEAEWFCEAMGKVGVCLDLEQARGCA